MRLPGGIVHDQQSDCWYVNTRTRTSGPASAYNPLHPAAYYSNLSPRLLLENRTVNSNGFVEPRAVAAGSADSAERISVSQVIEEGVVGRHITVQANGCFDDSEDMRRGDLERALDSVIPAIKSVTHGGHKGCYNIGIIYNFLLSGEMKNGQRAEERADGGIFKKVTSLRCWPKSNLNTLLQRCARDVLGEMIDRVDEGGDSIFYGVSHWRLLRVNISVSPVTQGGRGGGALGKLTADQLPVSDFLRRQKRNTVIYSPPVRSGCLLHCLARAMCPKDIACRNNRSMSYAALSLLRRPQEYDTDGLDVPCSQDIIQAFAAANGVTINVFVPAEEGAPPPYLLDPVIMTPKGDNGLPHVDLLYYDEHWMLILNIGRVLRGWDAGVHYHLCKYCLAVVNPKQNAHVCSEDATTLSIRPAASDAFYSASNAMFAGRLPLSLFATLDLSLQSSQHADHEDEVSFELELCQTTELYERDVEERLLLMPRGRDITQLIRALQHLAFTALGEKGLFRRFATNFKKESQWRGEPCAACSTALTNKTAVYHHDHLYGNFVAWVCQRCNKAEALRDVIVVTRGLKSVAHLLLSSNDNLGVMRVSHVGDWKNPLSLNISWRQGSNATRFGVRLISIEKLCNSASGDLGRGSLCSDARHLRELIWGSLSIEPMRFMTLPQIAEAACLTTGGHSFRLPYTEEQMRLLQHPAGGLVFAEKGVFNSTALHSIAEFDISKCFGALLHEKVACDISPSATYFCSGDDWHDQAFEDTWISSQVDTSHAIGMANLPLPARVQAGLPVPRCVLLVLEACGAKIHAVSYYKIVYKNTHTALIQALSVMHKKCSVAADTPGAQIAKAMMVTSYGKLAQNDRAWPSQQIVMSDRDTRLSSRQMLPSLRVELVKQASHELLSNVWELEPILQSYPRQAYFDGRRDVRVLCVEDLRQRICAHPGIIVLRIFYRSYLVVECDEQTLLDFLSGQHLMHAVSYEQRTDKGIEVITRASSRARTASRPVYAGQDIAMRSWAKIYAFLNEAVLCFGKGNVFVIRVMVDCLTLYVRHERGVDVDQKLRNLDVAGDGCALGTWKNEFAGEKIDKWFQLNKTGYEVRFHAVADGKASVKRRLGGIPKADRDALPPWTFDVLMTDKRPVCVHTSKGDITLSLK